MIKLPPFYDDKTEAWRWHGFNVVKQTQTWLSFQNHVLTTNEGRRDTRLNPGQEASLGNSKGELAFFFLNGGISIHPASLTGW